ncbi:hydrogenase maturation protease [Desulforhopalus sp. IMCC35007]|uniref:hydrogenase maturation protease n=1 Tax=Desulforhopalus sp. IMCC35007 TaxID=2569543 RepID=UPI0010AED5AF|nr:hydrogenase maturation protease [Desulforhopalus sp. IMCC35007]TKB12137.1 hydrogenase maturation protease [Desulforhopalus sp. IMCC35007]
MRTVLVVCIGNQLVADDGVGQVIFQELAGYKWPETVRVKFLGLGGIDLIEELQGEDLLVVVDGVQLGFPAGSVVELCWADLPATQGRPVSGHGLGVREAIEVTRKIYPERCPKEVMLVGVEGRCFDQLGKGLSLEVAEAIPEALGRIVSLAGCKPRPLFRTC